MDSASIKGVVSKGRISMSSERRPKMKKKNTTVLQAVAVFASVMLMIGLVEAKATKTSVSGAISIAIAGPAERTWIDEEGIVHRRGLPAEYVVSGDLAGTGTGLANLNLDPMTGNGDETGQASFELTWGELSGTFEGRWSTTFTGFVGVGSGVLHGGGDFEGMKMMISFVLDLTTGGPPVAVFEAIILDPHGE